MEDLCIHFSASISQMKFKNYEKVEKVSLENCLLLVGKEGKGVMGEKNRKDEAKK